MFTEYLRAAMKRAEFEVLEEDGSVYGRVPEFRGAWANAPTIEECRRELQEIIEEWILISIADHDVLPVLDGIDLNVLVNAG
jgi:predicted RNase H-like HicB family nuclease